MKKVILVDGNNLMFRSYYATAYNGNLMKNSKGVATNALYGFVNMMHKIIAEEKPEYIMVAFDIGKNFRKEKYETYKAGRIETPEELKMQMPIARDILTAMGIKYYELEPYEADDIIGTFAKYCNNNNEYDALIVSSDKDLLQLITPEVEMKLLKTKDYIKYNPVNFKEDWGFEPIHMIDYKALAGDASDNIPGVRGVGDKTAIKLLKEYKDLEDIYNHIDEIKGSLKDKLVNDKEMAFVSKEMATIYKNVPIDVNFDNIKYTGPNEDVLYEIYKDLEFYSLIKNFKKETPSNIDVRFTNIMDASEIEDSDIYSFYIECDKEDYHDGNIVGMSVSTKKNNYYVAPVLIKDVMVRINDKLKVTYDLKKNICLLNDLGIKINNTYLDIMIAAYLLELNVTDDIAYLMNPKGYDVTFYDVAKKSEFKPSDIVKKSRYIFDSKEEYVTSLKREEMFNLYKDIEHPLIKVLADMELTGIKCDKNILESQGAEVKQRIDKLDKLIQEQCGEEFNVASPRQLGVVLFEHLNLPFAKKIKSGYKTDQETLRKLVDYHPAIKNIIEYRNITKLYNTYLDGLVPYIKKDGKIHTTYKQNMTRTGRLSSAEPNMQNIPARDMEGKKIKKAFFPSNDILMSCDYSQIELRLLAHISGSKELQSAFINGEDIHTKVAADIHNIPQSEVTKEMRSTAKAVIFGIVYGISGFGLGENLNIKPSEAKKFIDKYYELYPGVKRYMDSIIKEAYDTGVVRTLFNRKRTIEELQNKNYMIRQAGERIALNTPIQGTCADIMKKAMVEIYDEFERQNIKSKMILQVHDELIFDCVESERELVSKIVTDKMENAIKIDVPIKVSHDFGNDWYETK